MPKWVRCWLVSRGGGAAFRKLEPNFVQSSTPEPPEDITSGLTAVRHALRFDWCSGLIEDFSTTNPKPQFSGFHPCMQLHAPPSHR
ncbi:hypothetical protein PGB90_007163 [Kerria lacca]